MQANNRQVMVWVSEDAYSKLKILSEQYYCGISVLLRPVIMNFLENQPEVSKKLTKGE